MDFTLSIYEDLLNTFKRAGFSFQTFEQFLKNPLSKSIILRHDVDRLPLNSLRLAQIENRLEISGSYYFRIVKESNNSEIIRQIANLKHEIGYHYEDLTSANGDRNKAFALFSKNLKYFREFYPIKTICMHGSPLSKWNNCDLWIDNNYHDWGIIGEPYFDIDYSKVFYITDTGRKWNNQRYNIRDKVNCSVNVSIRSTSHLISLIEKGALPNIIMINTHPHRWFNLSIEWYRELLIQNIKNVGKLLILHAIHGKK